MGYFFEFIYFVLYFKNWLLITSMEIAYNIDFEKRIKEVIEKCSQTTTSAHKTACNSTKNTQHQA